MSIRVAVIEDHPLMLKAVVRELDGQDDIEVVGTVAHGTELLRLARETCHSKGQTGKCGYYACARHGHQPEQVHPDCPGTIGSKKLDDEVWRFVVTICLATIAVQQQADYLKEWADEYLSGIKRGLRILETDVGDLNEEERDNLCTALEADRFLDKFHGDRLAALRWAILEEKRRTVHALVSDVLVVKGENGEKIIVPQLALKIPREYASLAYSDQSLEYVENFGGVLA